MLTHLVRVNRDYVTISFATICDANRARNCAYEIAELKTLIVEFLQTEIQEMEYVETVLLRSIDIDATQLQVPRDTDIPSNGIIRAAYPDPLAAQRLNCNDARCTMCHCDTFRLGVYFHRPEMLYCCTECFGSECARNMMRDREFEFYSETGDVSYIVKHQLEISAVRVAHHEPEVNGVATVYYRSGDRYVGGFREGNKHGDGVMYRGATAVRWAMYVNGIDLMMPAAMRLCYRELWRDGLIGGVHIRQYLVPEHLLDVDF